MTEPKIFEKTFISFPLPILLLQANPPYFTIINANTAYLNATNTTAKDLIGKGVFEAFPDDPNDALADGVENLNNSLLISINTCRPHTMAMQKYDIPIRGSDQFETKYWSVENTPVFSEDGRVETIINTVTDITAAILQEKKQENLSKASLKFQAALVESETNYKKLFDNNPLPMIVWDFATLRIIDCNEGAQIKYGYTKEEFLQLTIKEIRPEEDIPLLEAFVHSEEPYSNIYKRIWRHKKKNGEVMFVNVHGHLIDYNGRKTSVVVLNDITEKLAAENLVKESEAKYRSFFENSIDGVLLARTDGQILAANPATCAMFQMTEEEICKAGCAGIADLEDTRFHTFLQQLKENGNAKSEITHIRKDGSKFEADVAAVIFTDTLGQESMSVLVRDITERKKAEQAVQESNQRYQYATKATSDAIWDWDLINDKVVWGEGFQSIFGYNLYEMGLGNNFRKHHIHAEDVNRVMSGLAIALNGQGINWADRYRFLKADNTFAFVTNKAFIIRDEQGKATRMVGAKRDITKRREEVMQLKLLESVVIHTHDAVIIAEAEPIDGNTPQIMYVNDAFTAITGYTATQVVGKTPRILQGPKTDRQELDKLSNALKNWESCEITVINYKKNGEEFWSNISISPVADETGWFTHWIGIQRDVTESRLEEQKITKAIIKTQEDERYEIGAELHDNVCQILIASQITFKMLKKALPAPDAVWHEKGLDYINLALSEIRNLSHRLAPAFFEDTTLEVAFSNLIKIFNIENKYKIIVYFDDAFKQFPAKKDFQLNLYRILQEQIKNILKYADATEINVAVFIEQHKLKMTIYDNGIGFDANLIRGGIGLANMKRRTELFGGTFEIASSPGNGCKIIVQVPLKDAE